MNARVITFIATMSPNQGDPEPRLLRYWRPIHATVPSNTDRDQKSEAGRRQNPRRERAVAFSVDREDGEQGRELGDIEGPKQHHITAVRHVRLRHPQAPEL